MVYLLSLIFVKPIMKRACPFNTLPRQQHPSLRLPTIFEPRDMKRKCEFETPDPKRLCTHKCLKRKAEPIDENTKRQRLHENESLRNMLVNSYTRINHLEQIIKQLHLELEFYRQKTSCVTYNNEVLAY